MYERRVRLRRRRGRVAVAVAIAVVLALGGAGGAYLLLRTTGSPRQAAAAYLTAWQHGDYPAMTADSVHTPPGGLAGPMSAVAHQLGVRHLNLALGRVSTGAGGAQAAFSAAAGLASGQTWRYQGRLRLVTSDRRWRVEWAPSAIYPALKSGQRFGLRAVWPPRGQVLAADGTVLSSPAAVSRSGSIALLTGVVAAATPAQAKALGAPYPAGDLIGEGGVEQAYQARLAGRPALSIMIEGPGSRVDATVARFAATPGQPVRTSIEMRVQLAAAAAVRSAATTKPVDVVAIQPSTGRVLAVVERPGGFDRALAGIFPPGSTFKIVTASALARTGMRPGSTVRCPSRVDIGGRIFHNYDYERFGTTTLRTAFAVSCNTTFAMLATERLTGATLGSMARTFGFNVAPQLGIPATLGHFAEPRTSVDMAADAFGQGTDLVNPLSEAGMAGAIEAGAWRPPQLVVSPAPRQPVPAQPLSPAILNTLRPMMRAVVTVGTASHVGFPPGVYGKTGTAEYGSGPNPPSHAWFVGYRGDLAFAVLVEGGGVGADQSGPIANAFLRRL